jgi:hypothetical protein
MVKYSNFHNSCFAFLNKKGNESYRIRSKELEEILY